jgi:hypothetical protein
MIFLPNAENTGTSTLFQILTGDLQKKPAQGCPAPYITMG